MRSGGRRERPPAYKKVSLSRTDMSPPFSAEPHAADRRHPVDRRKRTFRALIHGSLRPRRRGPRRLNDVTIAAVDWHPPQWLAVVLLVLLASTADALLTITLVHRGAYEANPLMAPLVNGSGLTFAIVKIALTAAGVVSLVVLAHVRVFRIRVSFILYGVLFVYAALIAYELWLLQTVVPT
jgi:hypothetical protein